MNESITLNCERKLFVIAQEHGVSCLGFEVAHSRAKKFSEKLGREDLKPTESDYGTLIGYDKYVKTIKAWADSVMSKNTWFDPGTPKKIERILESYRVNSRLIRIFHGDGQTGRDYCEENDVVGFIRRNNGPVKVPLLVLPGENFGGAISTNSVVKIMDVQDNKVLYQHPTYTAPMLRVECQNPPKLKDLPFEVYHSNVLLARFTNSFDAEEYRAFLAGEIAATNALMRLALKRAA